MIPGVINKEPCTKKEPRKMNNVDYSCLTVKGVAGVRATPSGLRSGSETDIRFPQTGEPLFTNLASASFLLGIL